MININNEISVENMQLKYGTRPLIYELRVEREREEKKETERERKRRGNHICCLLTSRNPESALMLMI